MTIDYSKWDTIVDSDDEDDADVSRTSSSLPFQRVNFSSSSHAAGRTAESSPSQRDSVKERKQEETWTENGASHVFHGRRICWSQDRYHIYVRVELLPDDAIKDMQVQLRGSTILSYADRHASVATSSTSSGVKVAITTHTSPSPPVLLGTLHYPIHLDEGDDYSRDQESFPLDWTVEYIDDGHHNRKKFAEFQLNKASPMDGLALWWRRLFQETAEIELPPAAAKRNGVGGAAFRDAWEEAHTRFKEKIKQQHNQLEGKSA